MTITVTGEHISDIKLKIGAIDNSFVRIRLSSVGGEYGRPTPDKPVSTVFVVSVRDEPGEIPFTTVDAVLAYITPRLMEKKEAK